jgi:valyl-tRNA synthetase
VKITPAHDFNDFEVGRRHGLPLINIFDQEARVALQGNEAFLEGASGDDLALAMALHGLDRFEARKRVVALMEERELLADIQPNVHAVPHGDRSGVVVEPYLTDQWYVNVKPLAERAVAAVRDGKTRFVPENWEKTYFQWLENIEPWCVSRQLWWGHQIPAWYDEEGNVYVALPEEARVHPPARSTGATWSSRRSDVLDTWFSSRLGPSHLGWPETPERRATTDERPRHGFDIIFFWVARMMMAGLHFMDACPRTVYIHALVRDESGAKMSKSKGNVIDPLGA